MKRFFWLVFMIMVTVSCGKPVVEVIPTLKFQNNPDIAEGTSQHITVTASTNWVLSLQSDGNWVKASKSSGTPENGDVRLDYSANTSENDRSAVITIKAGAKSADYTFTQKGKAVEAEETIQVQTQAASSITSYSAVLNAQFKDASISPREIGFEWGTSSSELREVIQSQDIITTASGSFKATLENLDQGTTYYFRAYVVLMKDNQVQYYYGSVEKLTTSGSGTTSAGVPGWFELPAQKDSDHNGIDDSNPDYYYSWTMRADAPKVRNFSACYSKSMIHPVWSAAPIHSCYKGSASRSEAYKNDPAINCEQSPKFDGYTRGHMIGSSERTVSSATNAQVFYYSNIGAQIQTGFNTGGGAWNNLEELIDEQSCADTLYKVVGCIFETFTDNYGNTVKKQTGINGNDKTFQVPTAWYTVVLRTKKGNTGKRVDKCSADELKCAAFILTHRSNAGHKPSASDLYTVEDVEKLTGLTFFVNVPNAPKSTVTASDWGL